MQDTEYSHVGKVAADSLPGLRKRENAKTVMDATWVTGIKKKGMDDSPERCKYAITAVEHEALKSGYDNFIARNARRKQQTEHPIDMVIPAEPAAPAPRPRADFPN